MFNFYSQQPITSVLSFLHLNFFLSLVSTGIMTAPQRKHNRGSYCILTSLFCVEAFCVEATLYRFRVAVVMVFSYKADIATLNPSVSSSPCPNKTLHSILYGTPTHPQLRTHTLYHEQLTIKAINLSSMLQPTTEIF